MWVKLPNYVTSIDFLPYCVSVFSTVISVAYLPRLANISYEGKMSYEITMLCVCVYVLFNLLDQVTKHYEIWYGHYATGTHPKAEIFNLLQYVKHVWMHEVLKCEVDCVSCA